MHGTWFFVPWIRYSVFTRCAAVSVARQLGLEEYTLAHSNYAVQYRHGHISPTSLQFLNEISRRIEAIDPKVLVYFPRMTCMSLAITTLACALSFQPRMGLM